MSQMIELRMTRQQFFALHSLVLNRFLDSRNPDYQGVSEWIDVDTDTAVTIEDLLALLSIKI